MTCPVLQERDMLIRKQILAINIILNTIRVNCEQWVLSVWLQYIKLKSYRAEFSNVENLWLKLQALASHSFALWGRRIIQTLWPCLYSLCYFFFFRPISLVVDLKIEDRSLTSWNSVWFWICLWFQASLSAEESEQVLAGLRLECITSSFTYTCTLKTQLISPTRCNWGEIKRFIWQTWTLKMIVLHD